MDQWRQEGEEALAGTCPVWRCLEETWKRRRLKGRVYLSAFMV